MSGPQIKERILVADDEEDVVRLVAGSLTSAGFEVIAAHDGAQALEKARQLQPALILLDLMMPVMSGMDALRVLKSESRTSAIPVIMLTARRDEIDRVLAFELGADDYQIKPFSPRELNLRIKAILFRGQAAAVGNISTAGQLMLDRERHEVLVQGKGVEVTAMEFRLLAIMMQRVGRVCSRDELISSAWGSESEIDSRTVDTHLRRLREKLGAAANQIQTVRGLGYRMSER